MRQLDEVSLYDESLREIERLRGEHVVDGCVEVVVQHGWPNGADRIQNDPGCQWLAEVHCEMLRLKVIEKDGIRCFPACFEQGEETMYTVEHEKPGGLEGHRALRS